MRYLSFNSTACFFFQRNTTAASIPLALDEAIEKGIVGTGSTVMFIGLGAGLTWGAVLYRFAA